MCPWVHVCFIATWWNMSTATYCVVIHWLTRALVLSDSNQYKYSMTYQQEKWDLPSVALQKAQNAIWNWKKEFKWNRSSPWFSRPINHSLRSPLKDTSLFFCTRQGAGLSTKALISMSLCFIPVHCLKDLLPFLANIICLGIDLVLQ